MDPNQAIEHIESLLHATLHLAQSVQHKIVPENREQWAKLCTAIERAHVEAYELERYAAVEIL